MGLINNTTEVTREEQLASVNEEVLSLCQNMFEKINRNHTAIWKLVWDNRQGFTPQEVVDSFGTDAGELFLLSDSIQTLAGSACSDYVTVQTPNEYEINPDGTIIIGQER